MDEEKRSIRTRRIGSVTFGVMLVILGVLFLVRLVVPGIDYYFLLRLWPLVFVSLGVEVLLGSRRVDEIFVYDWAAILLMCVLLVFAMVMGGMDWVFAHTDWGTHLVF